MFFASKTLIQRPCKNKANEAKTTPAVVIQIWALMESIASKRRKEVKSVRTNPTPRAALVNAIVLIAETVKMFDVKQSA